MSEAYVIFYVELPDKTWKSPAELMVELERARILVPGWPDMGFRGEVISVGKAKS